MAPEPIALNSIAMNAILSLPLVARVIAAFVLGGFAGGAANWAIRRFAWYPRPTSSVRPTVLVILAACGYAALYYWEVALGGLLPSDVPRPFSPELQTMLHLQFLAHGLLVALMLAASMIDLDEKIIPDEITVAGTLAGLLIAAARPWSLLPVAIRGDGRLLDLDFLTLASPNGWPADLDGFPLAGSLILGLTCWLLWCVAILPRTWYGRHGWYRAMQLAWARIAREPSTYRIARMAVVGSIAIALVWFQGQWRWGQPGWAGLLSALVGMAAGGGLIWAVRIVGKAVLKREAMGFGDVTLMAMLGAFLGWQPCLVIFFLAPFAGLVVGVLRLILFRDKEIPYGPFLCLAALFVIIRWDAVWQHVEPVFALGWLVPMVMLCCLVLMAAMLGAWQMLLTLIGRR